MKPSERMLKEAREKYFNYLDDLSKLTIDCEGECTKESRDDKYEGYVLRSILNYLDEQYEKERSRDEKIKDDTEDLFWKPEEDEDYFWIDWNLEIGMGNGKGEHLNYFGGCFRTREEAQREADKILARRKIEAFARKRNRGDKGYYQIQFERESRSFVYVDCEVGYKQLDTTMTFSQINDAQDCIKLFEKELKLLMGVD